MYGFSSIVGANATSGLVSQAMVDYWLSFAVSGTPNDGKGLSSTCFILSCPRSVSLMGVHSTRNYLAAVRIGQPGTSDYFRKDVETANVRLPQVLIQFDTTKLTSDLSNAMFAIIPDDYRAEQIAFINSVAGDFNQ